LQGVRALLFVSEVHMSDGEKSCDVGDGKKNQSVSVEIAYCPCLGFYHYKRDDGDEFFWDNDKLEQTLEAYLRMGKMVDAEFMARLTTASRETPHKILKFDGNGKCEVRDAVIPDWVPKPSSGVK
jgi:hypothetical protein